MARYSQPTLDVTEQTTVIQPLDKAAFLDKTTTNISVPVVQRPTPTGMVPHQRAGLPAVITDAQPIKADEDKQRWAVLAKKKKIAQEQNAACRKLRIVGCISALMKDLDTRCPGMYALYRGGNFELHITSTVGLLNEPKTLIISREWAEDMHKEQLGVQSGLKISIAARTIAVFGNGLPCWYLDPEEIIWPYVERIKGKYYNEHSLIVHAENGPVMHEASEEMITLINRYGIINEVKRGNGFAGPSFEQWLRQK